MKYLAVWTVAQELRSLLQSSRILRIALVINQFKQRPTARIGSFLNLSFVNVLAVANEVIE
jgi:hypothetical protein